MFRVILKGIVDNIGICREVPKTTRLYFIDINRHPLNKDLERLEKTPKVGDFFYINEWSLDASEQNMRNTINALD